MAFLQARMESGIDLILDLNNIDNILKKVDLVITGEGRIDRQTLMGKTPYGVARRARKFKVPVIGIAGSVESEVMSDLNQYFTAVFSIIKEAVSLEEAMANSQEWLQLTSQQVLQVQKLTAKNIL